METPKQKKRDRPKKRACTEDEGETDMIRGLLTQDVKLNKDKTDK